MKHRTKTLSLLLSGVLILAYSGVATSNGSSNAQRGPMNTSPTNPESITRYAKEKIHQLRQDKEQHQISRAQALKKASQNMKESLSSYGRGMLKQQAGMVIVAGTVAPYATPAAPAAAVGTAASRATQLATAFASADSLIDGTKLFHEGAYDLAFGREALGKYLRSMLDAATAQSIIDNINWQIDAGKEVIARPVLKKPDTRFQGPLEWPENMRNCKNILCL